MPRIDKTMKKTKRIKKPKKQTVKVKVSKRTKNLNSKPIKNPVAYFDCMKTCCQKKQKISKTAHECKTNALAVNAKMSTQKKKDLTELARKHDEFRKVLGNYVKKY